MKLWLGIKLMLRQLIFDKLKIMKKLFKLAKLIKLKKKRNSQFFLIFWFIIKIKILIKRIKIIKKLRTKNIKNKK